MTSTPSLCPSEKTFQSSSFSSGQVVTYFSRPSVESPPGCCRTAKPSLSFPLLSTFPFLSFPSSLSFIPSYPSPSPSRLPFSSYLPPPSPPHYSLIFHPPLPFTLPFTLPQFLHAPLFLFSSSSPYPCSPSLPLPLPLPLPFTLPQHLSAPTPYPLPLPSLSQSFPSFHAPLPLASLPFYLLVGNREYLNYVCYFI